MSSRSNIQIALRDIVRQFPVEASVIALIGAGIGVLLGILQAYTICRLRRLGRRKVADRDLHPVLVGVLIAVGFGVYPAMSAAKTR